MNSTRLFRILICALVICSLLISWSPIRANATMVTTGTIVAASVLPVVVCVLGGLGITQAAAIGSTALQPIAESCIAHLQELGLCQETTIDVFGYKINGISVFGVTPRLIEAIRSWLFDTEVLVDTGGQDGYWNYNGIVEKPYPQDIDLSIYPYITIGYYVNTTTVHCVFSTVPLLISADYTSSKKTYYRFVSSDIANGLVYYSVDDSEVGWKLYNTLTDIQANNEFWHLRRHDDGSEDMRLWCNYDLYGTQAYNYGQLILRGSKPVYDSAVDSSYDFELGIVAPSTESLEVGYPNWYNNSTELTDPNTEKQVTVLPIPSVSTYENALSIPQDQIWQGINTGTNTGTDSGTSSDTWQPPSNPGLFALDLTKYFPFCIPFDLYDLFTCLNADPVAPVIHWELPMPGGSTYPIELDLSPFNSVAQLLRRMQLLLFCVGLAIKTRDLIKG